MKIQSSNIKLKTLCIILICSMLVQFIVPLASLADNSGSLEVKLTSTATEIKAGDEVNINIYITGGGISYFDGYLNYDTNVFEAITSQKSIYVNSKLTDPDGDYGIWQKTFDAAAGNKVSISNAAGDVYEIPDDGFIGTIKLVAKANTDSTTINLKPVDLVDDNGDDVVIDEVSVEVPTPEVQTKYTITYNPNTTDSVSNMPTSSTIKIGGTDCLIADAPSREGYTFEGWNTEADGNGTPYTAGSVYSTDENLNLYAQWKIITTTLSVNPNGGTWEGKDVTQTFTKGYGEKLSINPPTKAPSGYTIRYNSNGGETSKLTDIQTVTFEKWLKSDQTDFTGTEYIFGTNNETLTAQYKANSITLPTATRKGATFKGWYTQAEGGDKIGEAETEYTPNDNITLVAQWDFIDYTLTIDPNGGSWNGSEETQTENGIYQSTKEISNPVAPKGYKVTLDNNDGISQTQEIIQTKTFDKWELTGEGSISGTTYTYGAGNATITAQYTDDNVELPTLTREGYTFDGWYTDPTNGTKVETPYMPASEITLYAHWTAKTYTITFNPGENATVDKTTKEVTYGEKYGELPTPTKEGYDFDGWYNGATKLEETAKVDITDNTEVTAKWVGSKYTITFNPGEGATVDKTTKEVTYGEEYGELPTPTKEGYIFKDWYTEETDGTKIESSTIVEITSDATLYAHWEAIQTTLTVNPNGGEWEGSTESQDFTQGYSTTKTITAPTSTPDGYVVTFDVRGGELENSTITQTTAFEKWTKSDGTEFTNGEYTFGLTDETLTAQYVGQNITLPTPTKIGATFLGWYTEAIDGTKVGEAEADYLPTEAITLYAHWDEIKYELTVDPNGGTWQNNTTSQTVEGAYNITTEIENPVAPKGYKVTLDNNDGISQTQEIIQTKTFDKWELTGEGSISGTTYTYGAGNATITAQYTDDNVELPTLTREGYTFDGWYTDPTNGTKVETPYMPASEITLYAHWTAKTYTITFNPGENATVDKPTKEVTYGEEYGDLPTPTKEGYDFDGWYNGATKIEETAKVDITDNTELTAKWVGAKYTITFNPGEDATVDKTTKEVTYGEEYGELPTPTKEGYIFKDWYTEETDGTKIESSTIVEITSDATLYAHWEAIQTTLTVNPNGGEWEGSTESQDFTQGYSTTKTITAPTSTPDGYVVTFDVRGGELENSTITQTTAFEKWTKSDGTEFTNGEYTFGLTDETLTAQYVGQNITLPTPTKIGATFLGWYTEAIDGTKVGEAEADYLPTEAITLYAHWDEIKYELTVDPNGGTWQNNTTSQTVEGAYNITTEIENPVAPKGYKVTLDNNDGISQTQEIIQTKTFDKWELTGEGSISGTTYTYGAGNATITAQYTDDNVELPTPTREGYTFDGWYTEAIDGTKVETPYMPDSEITLYAHWTANKYTVTFNPGEDATVDPETKEVTYGEEYGDLPTPVKSGYDFDGWYDGESKIENTTIVDITDNIELTAKWTEATFTVTFNPGEGATVDPQTKEVTYRQQYGELPTPTKEGYIFKDWYTEETDGTKIESSTIVEITSDATLYAHWEAIQTTLTVNPNGGEWEGSTESQDFTQGYSTTKTITAPTSTPDGYVVTFDVRGGELENSTITQTTAFEKWTKSDGTEFTNGEYTFGLTDETLTAQYVGQNITLPTPTKIGATFLGWYTEAIDGTKVGEAEADYLPTEAITLYAHWDEIKYELTVDPNGGTWQNNTTSQTVEGAYNITTEIENPVAPKGYKVTLDNNDGISQTQEIIQTKTFDKWELTGEGSISGTTYTYGAGNATITAQYTDDNVELPTPTREGYTFDGWYTEAIDGTKVETPYMPDSEITLYAHWTANKYTVTFNPGEDATVDPETKEVTYGEEYGDLPTPVKSGYDFDGWYDGESKIENTTIVDITDNIELTAKWIGKIYNVTFDANGGTSDVTSAQVQNGMPYGQLPNATKEGNTFKGWYDENNNKIENTTTVKTTKDITLTAQWEVNKYTVIFINDDGTILKEQEAIYGSKIEYTGETPVKANLQNGYKAEFIGWENEEKLENVTENITLKAKYDVKPIVYTITYYNLKESDNSSNPTTYTVEDSNIPLTDLENKDNYIFKGWYTSNDENAQKITSIDTTKMENIVLYAHWENDTLYLKSEKYKIGENNIDIYEENDIYLDKIEPETTVKELIANCDTNGTITVINSNGETLGEDDLVGTNMTIKDTRGNQEITLTAVVMGDLDGNGKVTATDLSALNQVVLKLIEIKNAEFKAADLDDNLKLTATDLSTVNNCILKNIKLTYDKTKLN